MSKYPLKIICPACCNGSPIQFYHECGGKRYIDEDLNLYCDKCDNKTFILDTTFRCHLHDQYKEVNALGLMRSLSISTEIPSNIVREMIKKLTHYL